jgi:hypothetical protein
MQAFRDGATLAERLARLIAVVDAQPGALAAHIAGSLKAAAMREHGPPGQADPFKAAIRRILDVEVLAKAKKRPVRAVELDPSH